MSQLDDEQGKEKLTDIAEKQLYLERNKAGIKKRESNLSYDGKKFVSKLLCDKDTRLIYTFELIRFLEVIANQAHPRTGNASPCTKIFESVDEMLGFIKEIYENKK